MTWTAVVTALGLDDGKGRLSFNKLISLGAAVVFAFTVVYGLTQLHLFAPAMVWTFGAIVIGAGFGLKGFSIAMGRVSQSNTATDTYTATVDAAKMLEAIRARRDPAQGQEDSGNVPEVHRD